MSILKGITKRKTSSKVENPAHHSPLTFQNRVILEVHSPKGLKQRVESEGNVLCTWGLNHLIEQLVSGSAGFATDWVSQAVLGTGATPVASGGDSMNNSTPAAVVLGGGSMVVVDTGNMTMQYNMTFDTALAFTANEIALFGSNTTDASMVAHKTFTPSVVKAAGETVNATYQIIAGNT